MNRDTSPSRSQKFCLSRSTMGLNGDGGEERALHSRRAQLRQQQLMQQLQQQPCQNPKEQSEKCTCPLDGSAECVDTCQNVREVTKEHGSRWMPSLKMPALADTLRTKQEATVASLPPTTPPTPSSSQCVTSTDAIATSHYRAQLEKYKSEVVKCGGDAAELNCKLNDIFLKRLEELDLFSNGDINLRLVTYQEWVELLLHINATILGNINDMEAETNQRIHNCFASVNSDRQDSQDENRKLRKDICTLIRIIQTAYNNNKNGWNFKDIHFETLDLNHVLGLSRNQCPVSHNENDTDQHVKALAAEIAEKYDEICLLRSQTMCLEKEIQTAHQKIILKDKAIACLREKLDHVECILAKNRQKSGCEFCCPHKQEEINERDAAVTKLNFLRDNLLALDNFQQQNECSDDDLDQDSRVLSHLKKRLSCLSESNRCADKKCQELEMQMRGLQHKHDSNIQICERNDKILKEIAEVISNLNGIDFAYDSIYNGDDSNPFCAAYIELYEKRVGRDSYDDLQKEKIDLHKTTKSSKHMTRKTSTSSST